MSELSEMISCCGSDCSTCYCYGEMCKGCNAVCGKVFHAPDGGVSHILLLQDSEWFSFLWRVQ